MDSSSRGASCTKPSTGVFRISIGVSSYIQTGAFEKIANDLKHFRKNLHFRCLTAKFCKNVTFKQIVQNST